MKVNLDYFLMEGEILVLPGGCLAAAKITKTNGEIFPEKTRGEKTDQRWMALGAQYTVIPQGTIKLKSSHWVLCLLIDSKCQVPSRSY